MRLAVGLEIVAAAQVLEVSIKNGEVGGEHGGGDFAAVFAVADEGVDHAGLFGWLRGGGDIRTEEIGGGQSGNSLQYTEERAKMPDLRMPIAQHHRSMWPLLHCPWTTHHHSGQPETSWI